MSFHTIILIIKENLNNIKKITTLFVVFGGSVSPKGQTEEYDGSSWTEVADLNTGRVEICGGGTRVSALAFGGDGSPQNTLTEEWTIGQNIKVITD